MECNDHEVSMNKISDNKAKSILPHDPLFLYWLAKELILENPQEFKQLQENLSLIPSVIEETLRYRSPIQSIFRFAVNDVKLGGKMISSGQKVIVWLGSANRDETVFNCPDRFDITRDTRAHLAFGSGIHFCIGAPLARLETHIVLEVMLQQQALHCLLNSISDSVNT